MLSVGKEVRSSPGVAGMLRDRCGRDAAGQVLMVKDPLCVRDGSNAKLSKVCNIYT